MLKLALLFFALNLYADIPVMDKNLLPESEPKNYREQEIPIEHEWIWLIEEKKK